MKLSIKTDYIDFHFENTSESFNGCNIVVKDIIEIIDKVSKEHIKLKNSVEP
jgi:hypothetical protein